MNHNFFISYSRVDSEFALRLVRDLRSLHIEVWFDQIDIPPGSNWDDEIERALDQAAIMIVVLSEASGKSENVRNEIGHALDQGKQVVPVLLSKGTVPLRITRLQREDFSGDYQTALAKLTRRLSGEGKTASLQAICSEDMRREARVAAVRLSAGKLPEVPEEVRGEALMRPSEPELMSSLGSVTVHPSSPAQWKFRRLLPMGLGLVAVAGLGAAILRPSEKPAPVAPAAEAMPTTVVVAPRPASGLESISSPEPDSTKAPENDRPLPAAQATNTEAAPEPPAAVRGAIVCNKPDFAGVCESISKNADLRSSQVGNDTVSSIRLGTCRAVKVCANIDFGGSCAIFKVDKPDLSRTHMSNRSVSSVVCLGSAEAAQ